MNKIEQILIKAKTSHWPYPKTFLALKNAGVASYTVRLEEGEYEAIYEGGFGVWKESALIDGGFYLEQNFYPEEIRAAIKKHAQQKTTYLEFLADIAASGVAYYKVDMHASTVTYFNLNKTKSYVEVVPRWEVVV